MWQRIQTVFLVIVILSLLASIFLPIWIYDSGELSHELYALHYSVVENDSRVTQYFPYSVTAVLAIAAITIALIEIRSYRNRVTQMKLGALNSLFMAGVVLSAVLFSNGLIKGFQGGVYGMGLWLPGVAVIFNLLANRFIRRDEKLVRDSDRLR